MNIDIIKIFGKIAGIAGLSLVVFFYITRAIITNKVSSKLQSKQIFYLFKMAIFFSWSIAVLGIAAWSGIYVYSTDSAHNHKTEYINRVEQLLITKPIKEGSKIQIQIITKDKNGKEQIENEIKTLLQNSGFITIKYDPSQIQNQMNSGYSGIDKDKLPDYILRYNDSNNTSEISLLYFDTLIGVEDIDTSRQ